MHQASRDRLGRVAKILVPAVLASSLLVGCSRKPSVAATVNDKTWTVEELEQISNSCKDEYLARGVAEYQLISFQADTLNLLMTAEASKIVANKIGLQITDEMIDVQMNMYETPDVAGLYNSEGCHDVFKAYGTLRIAGSNIPAEILIAEMEKLDIEVNPEYGIWKPGASADLSYSNSLSFPADHGA